MAKAVVTYITCTKLMTVHTFFISSNIIIINTFGNWVVSHGNIHLLGGCGGKFKSPEGRYC